MTQVAWERSIAIEALGPVERQDWADDLPSDAGDVSCREALRGTSDSPEPGAIEVCGTPYTLDSGSGFGEVVQDCVYEVYDEMCSYTVLDWAPFDRVAASGSDLSPYWPQPSLAADQRLGAQEESYRVVLVTEDGRYVYEPSGEAEFSRIHSRLDLGAGCEHLWGARRRRTCSVADRAHPRERQTRASSRTRPFPRRPHLAIDTPPAPHIRGGRLRRLVPRRKAKRQPLAALVGPDLGLCVQPMSVPAGVRSESDDNPPLPTTLPRLVNCVTSRESSQASR